MVADDQSIARNGLRWLLLSDPGILVVGETTSDPDMGLLSAEQADVLLLRFPAEPGSALETLRELSARGNSARTIILAETLDNPHVLDALELGARGVILKDSPAEVLFNSIRCVAGGGYWLDRAEVANVASTLRVLRSRRHVVAFGLTSRELEIVRAVVSGSTNRQIAEAFSISENTVKRHLAHVFNKVGASNRVELALFASHHRLI